ncbi:MAG: NAD(P)/FAD-dependent oxidoreductase [Bacteroidia bacterium]|nr:NAD(P)/FAD-dependent oxidoreductase [Bacteroidia bacterium]
MIQTDICIIGAGPVGLFAVFEAGLLNMRCHLVDVLPQTGGQLSEIYPKKPIYDIPGYPSILAGELVTELEKQIEPFKPTYTLGEKLMKMDKRGDRDFLLETDEGTQIECKVVVIAGGLGSFEPRKPALENLEKFEKSKGVHYMVKDPEHFRGKKLVLAGGGDSALDWTMFLAEIAEELTLVHRREAFRGAPDSAAKVQELAKEGKINLVLNSQLKSLQGGDQLESVIVSSKGKEDEAISCDYLIPLFGLSPKLGPIADWGLNVDKRAVEVDTRDYSTNVEGVYAIGDINTYPGKLKLILCGFHEAALMAHSAYAYMNPDKKAATLKYTTVSGISGFE